MVSFLEFLADVQGACTLNGLPDPAGNPRFERALLRFFNEAKHAQMLENSTIQARRLMYAIDNFKDYSLLPSVVIMKFLGLAEDCSHQAACADKSYREVILQLQRNGWEPRATYIGDPIRKTVRGFLKGPHVTYIGENAVDEHGIPYIKMRQWARINGR